MYRSTSLIFQQAAPIVEKIKTFHLNVQQQKALFVEKIILQKKSVFEFMI
jgi:hypothetical protein